MGNLGHRQGLDYPLIKLLALPDEKKSCAPQGLFTHWTYQQEKTQDRQHCATHNGMMAFPGPNLALLQDEPPRFSSLVATGTIPVGTSLEAFRRQPLAQIPLEDSKRKRCSRCLLLPVDKQDLVSCGRCKCEAYCSQTCQSTLVFHTCTRDS